MPLNDDDVLSSTLLQYCWRSAVEIVVAISLPDIHEKGMLGLLQDLLRPNGILQNGTLWHTVP